MNKIIMLIGLIFIVGCGNKQFSASQNEDVTRASSLNSTSSSVVEKRAVLKKFGAPGCYSNTATINYPIIIDGDQELFLNPVEMEEADREFLGGLTEENAAYIHGCYMFFDIAYSGDLTTTFIYEGVMAEENLIEVDSIELRSLRLSLLGRQFVQKKAILRKSNCISNAATVNYPVIVDGDKNYFLNPLELDQEFKQEIANLTSEKASRTEGCNLFFDIEFSGSLTKTMIYQGVIQQDNLVEVESIELTELNFM